MISKQAIRQYLDRPMESFTWLKKLPRKELLAAIDDLDPKPVFLDPPPWNNQLVMFLLGVHMKKFMFLTDMGTGKSRVILDLVSYDKRCGNKPCWLICVPNRANIENWVIEAQTYAPHLSFVGLDVPPKERKKLLLQEADFFIVHYAGLIALVSELKKVVIKEKLRRKRKISRRLIRVLQRKFTGVVLDESTAVMNKQSLTFRVCNQLAKEAKCRINMTGTPFGKDPMPLWSQFYIVDRGETLGETLGLFREVFYVKSENHWGAAVYTFRRRRTKDLNRLIGNRSIIYSEGECQDLPKRVSIHRVAVFPPDIDKYYAMALKQFRAVRYGDFRETKNSFLRLRQVSSGFLGLKDDETGVKAQLEFPANPKLEILLELIDEMPKKAKMLVFHEYVWTGNTISRALTERGIKHERLWSGQKDPRGALRRFREQPSCRILEVNNHSGAFGLNLQGANYVVFIESPTSPIVRKQAERRARRPGQKAKRVFIIDIVAHSVSGGHSIDERILAELVAGNDLQRRVLRGEAKL